MIMPAAALVLPIFLELNALHLIGSVFSVILPFSFFPFGVYLAYIYYATAIPSELLDAARVDGCGEWLTFRRIALPLAKPVLALVFFFSFVANWNNFFLPYVVLANSDQYPITVGLSNLLASTPSFNPAVGGGGQSVNIFKPELALATLLAVIPVAIVFLRLPARSGARDARWGGEAVAVAGVAFEGASKIFGDGTTAVDELDLRSPTASSWCSSAPPGAGRRPRCGWSPGLEEISSGVIRIGERVVNKLSPKSRDIAMVFQSYALYPHFTVYDNIAFPLQIAKVPKEEIRRRVDEAARILDLGPYLKRKPRALSGGQRQRVAMGRAIVRQPQAFLLDEPLSNLDAKLRVQMRADIKSIQHNLGVTTIYVTHDQVEAMTMGDRVAVHAQGGATAGRRPEELYDRPLNVFVGGFIGSPAMNMLQAAIERRNGALEIVVGDTTIEVDDRAAEAHGGLASFEGRPVVLGIRPESLEDAALVDGERPRLRGQAELREALGPEVLLHFSVAARQAVTEDVRELAEDVGDDRLLDQLRRGRRRRRGWSGASIPRRGSARATRSKSRSTSTRSTSSTRERASQSTAND